MNEKIFRTTATDKKGNKQKEYSAKYPLVAEGSYNLDKYATMVEAIKEFIKEPYDIGEVEEGVAGGIQNTSAIQKTQESLEKKVEKELVRYLRDEKYLNRGLVLAKPLAFLMGEEYYLQAPVALYIDKSRRLIETIRYKSSAATGMTRGITGLKPDDFAKLEKFYDLYADIQYVRRNIMRLCYEFADGKPYTIQANYYFLKKTTDKSGHFDMTFFEGGGNPVVGLEEKHVYGEIEQPTELDNLFAKYIEQATTVGFECDKNNCIYCNYKQLCNYNRANVKQDVHVVKSTSLGTPSKEQKAIIDAVCSDLQTDHIKNRYIKVNAGAGTGKTFTMVYLVITLLKMGYNIHDIFITSFTNAGVVEIKQRIAGVAKAEGMNISEEEMECMTFDAFYYNCIKKYHNLCGFPSMPRLLQGDVQKQYVEELVNEYTVPDVDYGRMSFDLDSGASSPWIVDAVSSAFQKIQTYHIDPQSSNAVDMLIEKLAENGLSNSMTEASVEKILELYTLFNQRLKAENLITYSHLPELMDMIYRQLPNLYSDLKYKFIIIDEFQGATCSATSL